MVLECRKEESELTGGEGGHLEMGKRRKGGLRILEVGSMDVADLRLSR